MTLSMYANDPVSLPEALAQIQSACPDIGFAKRYGQEVFDYVDKINRVLYGLCNGIPPRDLYEMVEHAVSVVLPRVWADDRRGVPESLMCLLQGSLAAHRGESWIEQNERFWFLVNMEPRTPLHQIQPLHAVVARPDAASPGRSAHWDCVATFSSAEEMEQALGQAIANAGSDYAKAGHVGPLHIGTTTCLPSQGMFKGSWTPPMLRAIVLEPGVVECDPHTLAWVVQERQAAQAREEAALRPVGGGNDVFPPVDLGISQRSQIRTEQELTALKMAWLKDPCSDLEDAIGFEAHREELLGYRRRTELQWEQQKLARVEEKAIALGVPGNHALATYVIELEQRLSDLETRDFNKLSLPHPGS